MSGTEDTITRTDKTLTELVGQYAVTVTNEGTRTGDEVVFAFMVPEEVTRREGNGCFSGCCCVLVVLTEILYKCCRL